MRVCSPSSRCLATLGPRSAGLTGLFAVTQGEVEQWVCAWVAHAAHADTWRLRCRLKSGAASRPGLVLVREGDGAPAAVSEILLRPPFPSAGRSPRSSPRRRVSIP